MESEFYLRFTPQFKRRWDSQETPALEAIEPHLTKTRPRGREHSGAVIVKMRVEIPDETFLPLVPEVLVQVPDQNVEVIHATVLPPDTDGS